MDTSGVATTRWKKRKTINHDLCVICQSTSKAYSVVKQPKPESVNKLLESCKIRHENHYSSVTDLFDIIGTITATEFIEKHFIYHRECYNRLTNIKTNVPIFDKNSCMIYQAPGGKFLQTGQKMLKVAEKLEDKSFYLRLNAIRNAADPVANDVRYHLKCWVKMQRLTRRETYKNWTILSKLLVMLN